MIMEKTLVNLVDRETCVETVKNNIFDNHYSYAPQDNITLFELALILPLFQTTGIKSFNDGVELLPETVKRHFKRT